MRTGWARRRSGACSVLEPPAQRVRRLATVLTEQELTELTKRWELATAELAYLLPRYSNSTRGDAVGRTPEWAGMRTAAVGSRSPVGWSA